MIRPHLALARWLLLSGMLATLPAYGGTPVVGPAVPKGFTGSWIERYRDGAKKAEYVCVNGRAHGPARGWWPNGRPRIVGAYKNGLMDGKCVAWHDNDKKWFETTYAHGKAEGRCESWFPTGRRKSVANFVHDRMHGPSENWHPNGTLGVKGCWKKGLRDGFWRYGQPELFRRFRGDKPAGWQVGWDAKGRIATRGCFRDGKPWDGSLRTWSESRRCRETRYYREGKEITKAEYEKALAAGKVPPLKAGKELDGVDLKPQPAPKVKGGAAKPKAPAEGALERGRLP